VFQDNIIPAPGPDRIAAPFLSHGSPALFSAITSIFNFSWIHSVVPTEWKKANAFAIFKKGDRSDPSAYRLICITSIIIRLFERVVNNRMVSYLDENDFFSKNQAGFRRNLSTLDNIYRLLRDVYALLAKGKQLPVVFLDIVKAFDRVPHDLLLYKLHTYASINGRTWGWLRAFLSGRQFRVTQNDQCSEWFPATAGVPQGCVLSPLLFAIYINDLDDQQLSSLHLTLALFADDGAGWPQHHHHQSYLSQFRILRDFVSLVEDWSNEWELEFSASKSQILLFDNKSHMRVPHHPITLDSHNIELVDHYKYLGLIFQSDGRWNMQFDSIVTKVKHTAHLISRINYRNSPSPGPLVTATLVKSILIPQMLYASQYWRPTKSQIHVFNQIIATPLRRAIGLHRSASAARTMWEFGIPDFETLRMKCLLQGINRSLRSSLKGNFLPSFLINDLRSHDDSKSSYFCRPIQHEFKAICQDFPAAASSSLPIPKKVIQSIITSSMTRYFTHTSQPKHLHLKPSSTPALYLSIDEKPIVCIRARFRLSVALTPHRKFIYRQIDNDLCCGESGDTSHVFLRCNKFHVARSQCIHDLHHLYIPVKLTVDLMLGLPPPLPPPPPPPPPPLPPPLPSTKNKSLRLDKSFLHLLHQQCLQITGDFLLAIDKIAHF
jgi:hypothetical protein